MYIDYRMKEIEGFERRSGIQSKQKRVSKADPSNFERGAAKVQSTFSLSQNHPEVSIIMQTAVSWDSVLSAMPRLYVVLALGIVCKEISKCK
jgi:hypothetical protein